MEENNNEVVAPAEEVVSTPVQEPVRKETTQTATPKAKTPADGYAVAGLVLGFITLATWIIPIFGYITGILAIIFGCVSKNKPKSVMAIVGIVMGSVGFALSLINSILGVMLYLG